MAHLSVDLARLSVLMEHLALVFQFLSIVTACWTVALAPLAAFMLNRPIIFSCLPIT